MRYREREKRERERDGGSILPFSNVIIIRGLLSSACPRFATSQKRRGVEGAQEGGLGGTQLDHDGPRHRHLPPRHRHRLHRPHHHARGQRGRRRQWERGPQGDRGGQGGLDSPSRGGKKRLSAMRDRPHPFN